MCVGSFQPHHHYHPHHHSPRPHNPLLLHTPFHPQVFGGAGCLSTHWVPGDGLVVGWLADGATPAPAPHHRLYFDHGTEGLDADYGPYQQRVDALMAAAGWREGPGGNYTTRVFPGAGHNEAAWRERLPEVLAWLLAAGPGQQAGDATGEGQEAAAASEEQ